MRNFLRYNSERGGDNLQPTVFGQGDVFYEGHSEYVYQESYIATRGIRKGLGRARSAGLVPEQYVNTNDAVIEVASNNILPGLSDDGNIVQFVKFRGGSTLKQGQDEINANILISQCLFGEFGSTYVLEDGKLLPLTSPKSQVDVPIEEIRIDNRLSLYEHDAINRQVSLLGKIANGNPVFSSITIGLPRIEYYLHPVLAYNAGLLDPQKMLNWFNAVDERYNIVLDEIKSRTAGKLQVTTSSPLDVLGSKIRAIVEDEKTIEPEPLMQVLADHDELWYNAMRNYPPQNFDQMRSQYAEALEELRLPEGANLRVVIKNPKEEKTFELSDRISAALRIGRPIIAMYALPQIVTAPRGVGLYRIPTAPSKKDIELIQEQY